MEKDYYGILGLDKNATDDEIKDAYRKLASKYHPDVSDDPQANEKMASINEAYSVLRDKTKKAEYDSRSSYSYDNDYYNFNNPYQGSESTYRNQYYRAYNINFKLFRKIGIIFLIIISIQFISSIIFGNALSSNNDNLSYSYDSKNNSVVVTGVNSSLLNVFNYTTNEDISIPEYYKSGIYNYEIKTIAKKAFAYNTGIKTITMYSTITLIEENAFYECSNLETIYFYGTENDFSSIVIEDGNEYFKNAKIIYKNNI